MERRDAIRLVQLYLDERNRISAKIVCTYSSKVKEKIVRHFNYVKYRLRLRVLRSIEIEKLIKPDLRSREKLVIDKKKTIETKYFWIIYWGPSKFVEELDIKHGLIGTGPILVDKKTSRLFHTSTSMLDLLDKVKKGEHIDLTLLKEMEIR